MLSLHTPSSSFSGALSIDYDEPRRGSPSNRRRSLACRRQRRRMLDTTSRKGSEGGHRARPRARHRGHHRDGTHDHDASGASARRPIAITAVIMLAIAITAVPTPPVIAHETMVLFHVNVNGVGDAVRPFYATSAHVIAVSGCCRRPLGIVLKAGAIRYSVPQAKQS